MVTTQLLHKDYFSTGDEVGGYTLLEIIGGGGEGAVWSAWDPKNERIVAMKFFKLDQTAIDHEKRKQDLANLATLEHDNIREVYEVGTGTGFVFFVMRYFPFGSLSEQIDKNKLTIEQILMIAAQVTAALSYIHSRKVVHRDLKP
ncbi:MAG: protein kinase, partial [Anaerolineales bacterium]